MEKLIFISLATLITAVVIAKILERRDRKNSKVSKAISDLKRAREKRLLWLKKHPYCTNPFRYQEYEELWDFQIGADMNLQLLTGNQRSDSWLEYKKERQKHGVS